MPEVTIPHDSIGAFFVGPRLLAAGAPGGPLAGVGFAVKDVFDVAGGCTGAGNPTWLADAQPAATSATAVRRMIDAGATLVGKTMTDELTYSLAGTNMHYGTPVNVNAPGHIPGGSSSGSAGAVAAGLVGIALGTDTGGSIRVPASYCGVFGFRPSWGRVPVDGVVPLAPSYDTAGALARDTSLLTAAAAVLLGTPPGSASTPVDAIVQPVDAWARADPESVRALTGALAAAAGRPIERVVIADRLGGLDGWAAAFRAIQGFEAWAAHGAWISERHPDFGPGVAARFAAGSRVTREEVDAARPVRAGAADRLRSLLDGRKLLAIPSTCGPAPVLGRDRSGHDDIRRRTLQLTCIAGHAGAPVVSMPLATVGRRPVGLSLVGMPGADEQVLAFAAAL